MSLFEGVKYFISFGISYYAHNNQPLETFHLPTSPLDPNLKVEQVLKSRLGQLNTDKKNEVFEKVWELAKMQDPCIHGWNWGENHAFDDLNRLAEALRRTGVIDLNHTYPMRCLPFEFGEGGLGSQYFSLSEKLGNDPASGFIGYVNGMGGITLEMVGAEAAAFSDRLASGYNLHCVYLPTHQTQRQRQDRLGFYQDVARMAAVNGGSYTKTSYLIAQQWYDFLDAHPEKKFLQCTYSEGAVHVNAALRITYRIRPELMSRIRILNFCPAYFILPRTYPEELQVMNFVKQEDDSIIPWGVHCDHIGFAENIVIVPHTRDWSHYHINDDFAGVAKPYIDAFIQTGDLY